MQLSKIDDHCWCVKIPMPNHPLKFSYAYMFSDENGRVAVIDPGWPTKESWHALISAYNFLGLKLKNTKQILLTHGHRDHSGLAGQLRNESSGEIYLHDRDLNFIDPAKSNFNRNISNWLTLVGAEEEVKIATAKSSDLPEVRAPILEVNTLTDMQIINVPGTKIRVHWTPGHTPGHVCFEDLTRNILFAGDHLLPRITPNISSMVGHDKSALSDYLNSFKHLSSLDIETVYPGHEHSFNNLSQRITELRLHHELRLEEMHRIIKKRGTSTTHEIAKNLIWSRDWGAIVGLQKRAALGEVLAHLYYLKQNKLIEHTEKNGMLYWSA